MCEWPAAATDLGTWLSDDVLDIGSSTVADAMSSNREVAASSLRITAVSAEDSRPGSDLTLVTLGTILMSMVPCVAGAGRGRVGGVVLTERRTSL